MAVLNPLGFFPKRGEKGEERKEKGKRRREKGEGKKKEGERKVIYTLTGSTLLKISLLNLNLRPNPKFETLDNGVSMS